MLWSIRSSCTLLLIVGAFSFGDEIDEAIKLFNNFKFDEARKAFQEILSKNAKDPRTPELYFYLARLAAEPESAAFYYDKIVSDYHDSRFCDKAYLELAKADFAREEYARAIQRLILLGEKFPDAIVLDQGLFWLGLAYMGSGDKRNGIITLKSLVETYPNSPWSARAKAVLRSEKQPIEEKGAPFTIQIGSFRSQANARSQIEKLKSKGLVGDISRFVVGPDTFFRVWVGEFKTQEQAKDYLTKLDSLGYKGNVVKK